MKSLIRPLSLLIIIILTCSGCKIGNDAPSDSLEEENLFQESDTLLINGETVVVGKGESSSAPKKIGLLPNAYILVDKPNLKLYVIDDRDTVFKTSVCCARNRGNKKYKDDFRTPEGEFEITAIHDASDWLYEGRIPHVYGPWFLRLSANGWQGIGIHGTNKPASIGHRSSKGCIRLRNEDISKVYEYAFEGMKVIVLPDKMTPILSGASKINKSEETDIENNIVDSLVVKTPEIEIDSKSQSPENPAEKEHNEEIFLPVEVNGEIS